MDGQTNPFDLFFFFEQDDCSSFWDQSSVDESGSRF